MSRGGLVGGHPGRCCNLRSRRRAITSNRKDASTERFGVQVQQLAMAVSQELGFALEVVENESEKVERCT